MRAASELAMRSGLWLQQADSCGNNIFESIHDRFEVFVNLGGFVPVAPSVMGSSLPVRGKLDNHHADCSRSLRHSRHQPQLSHGQCLVIGH
jgi:hypothetical protein